MPRMDMVNVRNFYGFGGKPGARYSKYHAQRAEANPVIAPELAGRSFGSKLERDCAVMLVMKERAGEISGLRFQHTLDVHAGIKWRVDFSYTETKSGRQTFHEAKGMESQAYRQQLKLFMEHVDARLYVTKSGGRGKLRTTLVKS